MPFLKVVLLVYKFSCFKDAAKETRWTVYQKHRSVLTPKEEIYGLRPAQYRKVN